MSVYQQGGKALSSLTGAETVVVGNGGPQITTATVQQIADLATLSGNNYAVTNLNTVGAGTITAAGIIGGFTARGGAQSATAFTDTTDTAVNIIAALPGGAPVGTDFLWTYENNTDGDATLAGGVGVTLSGNTVVPRLTTASYIVTYSAAGAVTLTYVNGGQVIPLPYAQFAADTGQSVTLQVTGITGAQICNVSLTGATPGAMKFPPATQIIAGIPNARVGLQYTLNIMNPAATSVQFTGLTGTTLVGTTNINPTAARQFNVLVKTVGTVQVTGMTSTTI